MKTIVIATSNKNKIHEIKEMMIGLDINVLSLSDLSLTVRKEETGLTFEENAKIKAEDIAEQCDYPVFSDDSGLCIDALDGFPGVHSARFMEGHTYLEKNKAILEKLKGIEDRRASFYTVMVYIDKKNGIEKSFFGKNEGEITEDIDMNPQGGFGYDPIFYSYDLHKRFSEASAIEKDSVSHRGRALRQLLDYLKEQD